MNRLICGMRRAALAGVAGRAKKLLFVPAGFDSSRLLEDQNESIWWTSAPFGLSGRAQNSYSRIVRGFDSVNGGAVLDEAGGDAGRRLGPRRPAGLRLLYAAGKLIEIVAVGGQGVLESAPFEREIANDFHQQANDPAWRQMRRMSTASAICGSNVEASA